MFDSQKLVEIINANNWNIYEIRSKLEVKILAENQGYILFQSQYSQNNNFEKNTFPAIIVPKELDEFKCIPEKIKLNTNVYLDIDQNIKLGHNLNHHNYNIYFTNLIILRPENAIVFGNEITKPSSLLRLPEQKIVETFEKYFKSITKIDILDYKNRNLNIETYAPN